MIELETFLNRLRKQAEIIDIVSASWRSCSFAGKYDIEDLAVSKRNLVLYVGSGIAKKDMEMHVRSILEELNGRLPKRRTVKNMEVKVRRK